VFLHGAMTAIAACMLPRGAGKAVQGYLVAVCLHAFVNLGALLYQIGAMSVEASSYSLFISLLVIAAIFEKLRRGEAKRRPPKEGVHFSSQ
ncbi:MAG TPA: hypothetical protein P5168_01995, partial [Candidatus Methanomethylicus sp.]|nr:hypothetical protein [Candidatus Methanomethylicus sp.]